MELKKFLFAIGIGLGLVFAIWGNRALANENNLYQGDPQSCAKCHLIKPYVDSWNKSDFMDHRHAKAEIACLTCHQMPPGKQQENVAKFNRKDYKMPPEEREYDSNQCFRCHGSYKAIGERTKDYKKRGWLRNPHESHYGEMQCNMCHKAHRASTDYCAQCHPAEAAKPGWK